MNSSNLAVLENLSPRSERLGSGRSFVLIIEDDRFSAVALSMLLDDWGYDSIAVNSAGEAIERLGGQIVNISAIVTDFQISGEYSGIRDTAALISAIGRSVPAIVTTGYADLAVKTANFPVLRKPFEPESLRAWLNIKNLF